MSDTPRDPETGEPRRHWWRRLGDILGWLSSAGTAVVVLIVVALFARELSHKSIEITPIAVPKRIVEAGYSPQGIAQRLVDQVAVIHERAQTTMKHQLIRPLGASLDFDVPGTGISIANMSHYLAKFIGFGNTTIDGEIVERGKELSLYLRVARSGAPFRSDPITDDNLERIIVLGAEEIVRRTEPYILASYYYNSERKAEARSVAETIILESSSGPRRAIKTRSLGEWAIIDCLGKSEPSSDEVKYAHNLLGALLEGEGNHSKAKEKFEYVIEHLDCNFVPAHINLGLSLDNEKNVAEAMNEFRLAATLDPESSAAHNNFGSLLGRMGDSYDAMREYRLAIGADPSYAMAHSNLGRVLWANKSLVEAESEYRLAILMNANSAEAHDGLGFVLEDEGDLNGAIREIWLAIEADPNFAPAHYDLARMLWQKNQHDEALDELRLARGLDTSLPIPPEMMDSYSRTGGP